MKQIKLFNIIFPIWMVLFFPPIIIITLLGNFIIDSLVILICFFAFKLSNKGNALREFYQKSIRKVWLYGFLSDFIGASVLLILYIFNDFLGIPDEIITGICYDPFSSPIAVIIIVFSMLISSLFIFLFNYKFTFKAHIQDKVLRLKLSITIAVITIPWTFILPTKWFYH